MTRTSTAAFAHAGAGVPCRSPTLRAAGRAPARLPHTTIKPQSLPLTLEGLFSWRVDNMGWFAWSTYDAYGRQKITAGVGGAVRTKSAVGFDRGFTGYITDNETGLLHARARQYSPTLGRFIGRDPLGYREGQSLYFGYFVPNYTDPSGLLSKKLKDTDVFLPDEVVTNAGLAPKYECDQSNGYIKVVSTGAVGGITPSVSANGHYAIVTGSGSWSSSALSGAADGAAVGGAAIGAGAAIRGGITGGLPGAVAGGAAGVGVGGIVGGVAGAMFTRSYEGSISFEASAECEKKCSRSNSGTVWTVKDNGVSITSQSASSANWN